MKVVVTGATGHIGNVLVRDLIERGYEVKSLALNEKDGEILKDLNTEIVYGDVRKLETLVKAFEGAEIVFHLAGIIEIGSGNKRKDKRQRRRNETKRKNSKPHTKTQRANPQGTYTPTHKP